MFQCDAEDLPHVLTLESLFKAKEALGFDAY